MLVREFVQSCHKMELAFEKKALNSACFKFFCAGNGLPLSLSLKEITSNMAQWSLADHAVKKFQVRIFCKSVQEVSQVFMI